MLLDIWMPDTDGISLLREWQQAQSLAAPVVMMSGHGTVETAVEATRLGAVDYVEKPLSLAKLLRTVRTRARGRRAPQAGGAQPVAAAARPGRPQPADARAARADQATGAARGSGADHRRARHRARGLRPLHSLAQPARREARSSQSRPGRSPTRAPPPRCYGSEADGAVRKGLLEQAERGVLFINELGDLVADGPAIAVRRARHGQLHAAGRHATR